MREDVWAAERLRMTQNSIFLPLWADHVASRASFERFAVSNWGKSNGAGLEPKERVNRERGGAKCRSSLD